MCKKLTPKFACLSCKNEFRKILRLLELWPQNEKKPEQAVMLSVSETSQSRLNVRGFFGLHPQDDRNPQDNETNLFTYSPSHLFTSKQAAFTLAEVLITLGIIGVVAAMTIPTLIQKYEKMVIVNQLKSTTSIMSQAVRKYMADEGITDLSQSALNNNPTELKRFFKDYLKIAQDCDGKYHAVGKKTCFASNYTDIDKTASRGYSSNAGCTVVVNLVNGVSVCADLDDGGADGFLALELDVNGKKGPNVFGKDAQSIYIKKDGKLFDIVYEQLNKNICTNCGFSTATGTFGRIMDDGWQITYY
jgi:prepilin-type N-terminal cleavage/methylation domain-containing protein